MKNHLILGNWNSLCDSCGLKFKALDLKKRWDGLMVCPDDYELRHPSDFLRVQKERITVPFSRPYPAVDTFVSAGGEPLLTEASSTIPAYLEYITTETLSPLYTEN